MRRTENAEREPSTCLVYQSTLLLSCFAKKQHTFHKMRALRMASSASAVVLRHPVQCPPLLTRQFSSLNEDESPLASLPERVRVAAFLISDALTSKGISHAIAGGVACHAHGHRRATDDVDVLVNAEDAQGAVYELLSDSACYSPRFRGSRRSWKDTRNKVDIDLLVSGDYPGDGLPKPVVFPVLAPLGPSKTHDWHTRVIGGLRFVELATLIELKLASALTAPHRLKDAADVQALIAANALPREFAAELHVSVRPEFVRLWMLVEEQRRLGLQ